MIKGLCYLATPYSKYPKGVDQAFKDAANLAGSLLKLGVSVYSPICHTHPIAIYSNIDPLDHEIWLPFDHAMLDVCGVLLVAHMDGWKESRGIAYEIEYFTKYGKPIYDLGPVTLKFTER